MKKSRMLIILYALLFITTPILFADSLEEVYIDVYLQEDGDALIKTKWVFEASKGTENYISIDNLGVSKIEDFRVSENGTPFIFVEKWKIKDSREQKTHKYGIVKSGSAYELCWGFGDFGLHTFDVEYKITDMVKKLKDAQALNFQFINYDMSTPPKKATVVIHADKAFNEGDVAMWAFGYTGDINLEDGKIVAKSSSRFGSSDYLTILLKFDNHLFKPTAIEAKTFSDVLSRSLEGSDYKKSSSFDFEHIIPIIVGIIFTLIFGSIGLLIVVAIISAIYFSASLKKRKKSLRKQYFWDIPYKGDIEDIFHLTQSLKIGKKNDLLSAFFLKWIKEGRLIPVGGLKGLNEDEVEFRLNLVNTKKMGKMESNFFDIVVEAAGENEILESYEFKKWAKKNYAEVGNFFENVSSSSKKALENEGYIQLRSVKKLGFIKYAVPVTTPKGLELEDNIIKFYNHLIDYSMLNERTSPNVHLWDEYMIYAALFGITKEVQREFEKLSSYQEYQKVTSYKGSSVHFATQASNSFYSSYSSASSSASRSSGGGGSSSSSGGGGGSSGGGGGGGSR